MAEDLGEPRVALVTGGGSGIGRATVFRLLRDGFFIVLADVNDAAAGSMVQTAVDDGYDGRIRAVHADVAVEGDVEAAVRRTVEQFGGLTCMVNNAGVGGAFGPVTRVDVADWDYTFAVLSRGVFLGTKHAARAMRAAQRPGSIVNIASIAGQTGGVAAQAYSAAKASVLSLTQTTAIELAAYRIRVNAVCPGVIATPLVHRGRPEAYEDLLPRAQPWPDAGRPEDVAAAVAFLAGPDSTFVTGQALVVDGGLSAAGPGVGLRSALGIDPATRGLAGVNRGSTGQPSQVRHRGD